MNKALMISIRPEHAINILNGTKLLELRKNVPKNYVGWVYIYCTKGKDILEYSFLGYRILRESSFYNNGIGMPLNTKVVARFWFDEYETIPYEVTLPRGYESSDGEWIDYSLYGYWTNATLLERSCLTDKEISIYGKGKDLYAWHIKKLEIFDKPMELSEFQNYVGKVDDTPEWAITSSWQIFHRPLEKGPQKMQWVYAKELENE